MNFFWRYIILVSVYIAWDTLNFKVLAKDLYNKQFKDGITNHVAAALVYTLYPLAVMYLTNLTDTWSETIPRAVVLGLTVYAVFNLTNMATLKDYGVDVTAWDTIAGTIITTAMASLNVVLKNNKKK